MGLEWASVQEVYAIKYISLSCFALLYYVEVALNLPENYIKYCIYIIDY